MKRILANIVLAASLCSLAVAPAAASAQHTTLLADQFTTVNGVRHSIDTWQIGRHRVRTDVTETPIAGGGVVQVVNIVRDGAPYARVDATYLPRNAWRADPEVVFADGKHARIVPTDYEPLRALSVTRVNADLARTALHPRMELTSARSPRLIASDGGPVYQCALSCAANPGPAGHFACLLGCLLG